MTICTTDTNRNTEVSRPHSSGGISGRIYDIGKPAPRINRWELPAVSQNSDLVVRESPSESNQ